MDAPLDTDDRGFLVALLAGDWAETPMADRAAKACGKRHRFVRAFARRLLAAFPTRPSFESLLAFAAADAGFARRPTLHIIRRFILPPPDMTPHPAAVGWDVPSIRTTTALADSLGLDPHQLDWFADGFRRPAVGDKLQHYRLTWRAKPGGRFRLIEAPKRRLKEIQRTILHDILDRIPPHPAAHGFRPGRSVVTNATPHTGRSVVLKFDLRDFFPSVTRARVRAVFRTAGYPEEVARVLANLCTTRLTSSAWEARPPAVPDDPAIRRRLCDFHLPQGAPTSPALANVVAYRLDCRLAALADSLDAAYTRYADDLTLSGNDDLRRAAGRVRRTIAGIAAEEGFRLNLPKSKVLTRAGRQTVTGVVVNVRPNLPRDEFDRLKAILTNCGRHGPAEQNRDGHPDFRAHLMGRVAHAAMLNPARGRKLWLLFDRIAWPAAPASPQ